MFGPKDRNENRNENQNASKPKEESSTEPKKGGFGAFADKYRERWEAEHPKTDKPGSPDAPPGSSPRPHNPGGSKDRPAKP